jgi:cell shape-determining protein MreC
MDKPKKRGVEMLAVMDGPQLVGVVVKESEHRGKVQDITDQLRALLRSDDRTADSPNSAVD